MKQQDVERLIKLLDDPCQPPLDREQAIQQLAQHPDLDTIQHLVQILEDGDRSVRQTAATVLAHFGDAAVVPLVDRLSQQPVSTWLREGAYIVLHENLCAEIRLRSAALQTTLGEDGADAVLAERSTRLLRSIVAMT